MTVAEGLFEMREKYAGRIKSLFLCKYELFYLLFDGTTAPDSVYPVTRKVAAMEAKHLKVEWREV